MLKTNNGDIIGNVPERTDAPYPPDRLLKIDAVCDYFGGSNPRTIDRWMEDDGFPRPFYIRKTRFWQFSEIVAWRDSQPKVTDIDDARKAVFDKARKKAQAPEARQKAAKTKRNRKAATDEEVEAARHALDLAEHNDSIGMAPVIKMRRDEYYALLKLRDGE